MPNDDHVSQNLVFRLAERKNYHIAGDRRRIATSSFAKIDVVCVTDISVSKYIHSQGSCERPTTARGK